MPKEPNISSANKAVIDASTNKNNPPLRSDAPKTAPTAQGRAENTVYVGGDDWSAEEGQKIARLNQQCFLIDNLDIFRLEAKNKTYSHLTVFQDGDPKELIRHLTGESGLRTFMHMTPVQIATLVPRVNIWIVQSTGLGSENLSKAAAAPLHFSTNYDPGGISSIMNETTPRGVGVILEEAYYSLDGSNPGNAQQVNSDYKLTLKFKAESMAALDYRPDASRATLMDLLAGQPVTIGPGGTVNSNPTRVRVQLGWGLGPSAKALLSGVQKAAVQGTCIRLLLFKSAIPSIDLLEDGTVQVVQEFYAQVEPNPTQDADLLGEPQGVMTQNYRDQIKKSLAAQKLHRAATNRSLIALENAIKEKGGNPALLFGNQGPDRYAKAFGDNAGKVNALDFHKKVATALKINYPADWNNAGVPVTSAANSALHFQGQGFEAGAEAERQNDAMMQRRYSKMFEDLLDNDEVWSVLVPKDMLGITGDGSLINEHIGDNARAFVQDMYNTALDFMGKRPENSDSRTDNQRKYGNRNDGYITEYKINRIKLWSASNNLDTRNQIKAGLSKQNEQDQQQQKESQKAILESISQNKEGAKAAAAKGNITLGGLQINPGFLPLDPSSNMVKIHFTYFGCLVNSALRICQHKSDPPNSRILLGTYTTHDPRTGESLTFPLADLPVSMDLYRAWLVKVMVAPAKASFSLKEYMERMIEDLVHAVFQDDDNGCMGRRSGTKARRTYTKWDTFEAPSSAKGKDRLPTGRVGVETVKGLMLKPLNIPAVEHPGYGSRNYIILHANNEASGEQYGEDEAADDNKGIYWLSVGSADGPIKEFKFERLEETRDEYYAYMTSDQGGGIKEGSKAAGNLSQLQDKDLQQMYKASVQILGNNVLKLNGDVFVNVKGIGGVKDLSIARGLGFGGAYKIVKKEGKIDSSGWWEDVECYPTPLNEVNNRAKRTAYFGSRRPNEGLFHKDPDEMTDEEKQREREAQILAEEQIKQEKELALAARVLKERKAGELKRRRMNLYMMVQKYTAKDQSGLGGQDHNYNAYDQFVGSEALKEWLSDPNNPDKKNLQKFIDEHIPLSVKDFSSPSILKEYATAGKFSMSAYWGSESDLKEAEEKLHDAILNKAYCQVGDPKGKNCWF